MSAGNSIDLSGIFSSEHSTAAEIASMWSSWDSARSTWKQRVKEVRQYVYATSTRETTNVKNPWSHSTNLGKLTQIYDNLRANYLLTIMPNDNWFRFEGEDAVSVSFKKRRNIESYIRTKNRLSDFQQTVQSLIDDWILTGNCFAGVTYTNSSSLDEQGLRRVNYSGPTVFRIAPQDIVFSPIATSFAESPKIVRTIKTLGQLSRELEDNPEMGYNEEILNNVKELRRNLSEYSSEDIDKHVQMEYDGFGTFGSYIKSGFVEILDFYGDMYDTESGEFYKNHVITVVDRRWVVRKQPLNTWTGRPHIYHSAWRERPDNLWGMGPLDNLVGLQYRINHLENARADAFDQMISSDIVYQGDVNEYEGPNGERIYEAPEGGGVSRLAPDTQILNADFQITALEDRMELYVGAPREAMGIRSPGEKTAFEVQSLQNASSRIFQSKANNFEKFLEGILNAQLEVARRNLNHADVVKVVDDETGIADFLTITSEELNSTGKLIPVGASHFARRAQLAQEMMTFQQNVMTDPLMQLHFPSTKLAQMWEEVLGLDRFGLYEPYARITEEAEAQRISQSAQGELQQENMAELQMAEEAMMYE